MRLEAQFNCLFPARQLNGYGIRLVEEVTRFILIQGLCDDYFAIDQNVEGAIARLPSPVGANQLDGLIGRHLDVEREPPAVFSMAEFATLPVAGNSLLTFLHVIHFGLLLARSVFIYGAGIE